jgi:hypothetical protein
MSGLKNPQLSKLNGFKELEKEEGPERNESRL